ncbi:ECF RNA polymerase sigma factor SigD [Oxobacter pfennigii]|uniref:ECF RNA polymerase sigma factor SigD n=1 Tax=Oxobacter pfennigii TaxID=36849 RepID=A0A0P8W9Y4_9CLOT|nr:sigma-70 family RNA polymerase sigma factor [Oxobacter pfennigii]KPU44775.1 ECF RNA polymerase sigma factor SigD [Oxobacter pfennigii]
MTIEDVNLEEIESVCLSTWEQIYRFIYYKVQNREEAEDITQETYVKTIAYMKKYKTSPERYIGFLKKVAHNILRDKWRKINRSGTDINLDEINPEKVASEDYTEASIQRQVIEDALNNLNDEQKNVIDLRIIKGYSVAETANIMGKGEGAVRSLQYRAVQNLQRILVKEE